MTDENDTIIDKIPSLHTHIMMLTRQPA